MSAVARREPDIYDYRFDGYWRIGQVFHHRNANDLDVRNYADDTCFLRGQLMKLTFAPMWVQMEQRHSLECTTANCTAMDTLMQDRKAYWDAKARVGSSTRASTGPAASAPLSPFAQNYNDLIRLGYSVSEMLIGLQNPSLIEQFVLMKAMTARRSDGNPWNGADIDVQLKKTAEA